MRRFYALLFAVIIILLFCWEAFFSVAQARTAHNVVINEIAWMGTQASTADEWIELYNATDQDIGLGDFILTAADSVPRIELTNTIPAQGYYLLERTDDQTISDISADRIYTEALANEGERLLLFNGRGEIIDEIDNSTGWFAGDNATKASMERIAPDQDSNQVENWKTNNQQIINGVDAANNPILGTPKAKNSASFPPSAETEPSVNYILLNELLPNPTGKDEDGEYVEIFNANDSTQDLITWKFQDASGSSFLIGTTIAGQAYAVFYTGKKFLLNNDGDTITLRNTNIVDSISYSGKVPENQSYNRLPDNTWAWSTTSTPGMANIITQAKEGDDGEAPAVYPRHIWINEFLPDPEGKDEEGEFIELYNAGPAEINLQDWQVDDKEDGGSRPFTFKENFIVAGGEYLALKYAQTKIALNNSGDWVRLLWPNGQAIDEVEYPDAPPGESYNKTAAGWRWSTKATPGEENIIAATESSQQEDQEDKEHPRTIWINEFLPDPEGKDEEGEFIELKNRGAEEIDLTDWQLDDAEEAGSRPYIFPEESKVLPDAYLVVYYPNSKIALNNDGDWVRLINPTGQAIDEIQYKKAPKGQSYSRQNIQAWFWTKEISPGQDNPLIQILSATQPSPPNAQSALPQTGPSAFFFGLPLILFIILKTRQKIDK